MKEKTQLEKEIARRRKELENLRKKEKQKQEIISLKKELKRLNKSPPTRFSKAFKAIGREGGKIAKISVKAAAKQGKLIRAQQIKDSRNLNKKKKKTSRRGNSLEQGFFQPLDF